MQLIQLYIQRDAAHDTVDELGELGNIQFHDVRLSLSLLFFFKFKNNNNHIDESGSECISKKLCC